LAAATYRDAGFRLPVRGSIRRFLAGVDVWGCRCLSGAYQSFVAEDRQRRTLVTSKRIKNWVYYKPNGEVIERLQDGLGRALRPT
jgi:hypothetical protein